MPTFHLPHWFPATALFPHPLSLLMLTHTLLPLLFFFFFFKLWHADIPLQGKKMTHLYLFLSGQLFNSHKGYSMDVCLCTLIICHRIQPDRQSLTMWSCGVNHLWKEILNIFHFSMAWKTCREYCCQPPGRKCFWNPIQVKHTTRSISLLTASLCLHLHGSTCTA